MHVYALRRGNCLCHYVCVSTGASPRFFYLCLYSVFFLICACMHVYALVQVSVFCVCVRVRARTGVFVVGVRCVS